MTQTTDESDFVLIDGRHYPFLPEHTLLDYATEHGLDIPTLCQVGWSDPDRRKDVHENAHCMVCAAWDDTLGRFVASCEQWVERGHVYETQGQCVREFRREALSLMLYRHDFRCGICSAKGNCRFFDLVREYQAKKPQQNLLADTMFPDKIVAKHVTFDAGKCILCHRCIGVSQGGLTMHHRAEQTAVSPAPGSWDDIPPDTAQAICEVCPTGALWSAECRIKTRK